MIEIGGRPERGGEPKRPARLLRLNREHGRPPAGGQSEGGDIVLSRAIADDPAVRPLLATLSSREESVPLKGFADPIPFVRLLELSRLARV
jgi:hypothetical protein